MISILYTHAELVENIYKVTEVRIHSLIQFLRNATASIKPGLRLYHSYLCSQPLHRSL